MTSSSSRQPGLGLGSVTITDVTSATAGLPQHIAPHHDCRPALPCPARSPAGALGSRIPLPMQHPPARAIHRTACPVGVSIVWMTALTGCRWYLAPTRSSSRRPRRQGCVPKLFATTPITTDTVLNVEMCLAVGPG